VFISPLAIRFTVGPDFAPATSSLNLLLISTAILAATSPFVALFYLFDKPQYFAYSGIIGSALLIGGDFWAIPAYGLVGAGYVRILSRLAVLLFTVIYARLAYRAHFTREN
jgi:O-antigen/teichoic acid export membrane protein